MILAVGCLKAEVPDYCYRSYIFVYSFLKMSNLVQGQERERLKKSRESVKAPVNLARWLVSQSVCGSLYRVRGK